MKLFDFVDKLRTKNKEPEKIQKSSKKDLGTCVPLHALDENERKKKLALDTTLEEQLKGQKKKLTDEELDFIDSTSTKDSKIKKDTLGLEHFGGYKIEPNDEEVIPKTTKKETQNKQPAKKEQTPEEIEEEIISKVEIKGHNTQNIFKVTGLYDFGSSVMISGFVEKGIIRNKMKWSDGKKEMQITEIKVSSTKVDSLIKGEEGSIFVKTKGNPIVRYDDALEFL